LPASFGFGSAGMIQDNKNAMSAYTLYRST